MSKNRRVSRRRETREFGVARRCPVPFESFRVLLTSNETGELLLGVCKQFDFPEDLGLWRGFGLRLQFVERRRGVAEPVGLDAHAVHQ